MIDPAGRFVVGSMWADSAAGAVTGSMYSVDAARSTTLRTDVGCPNGLAFDADRGRVYWTDTPTERVVVADYDPDTPHALVVGYAGTDWVGEQIQPYLDLEGGGQAEIFVYPDPLWRSFPTWGTYGGWVLGDNAYPADGMGDIVFTEALLDHLEAEYCIDTDRVFATGHSWGGDMAQVVSCFLGARFTASVPVAANRPYWFEEGSTWSTCEGSTAVWTMFGIADDHFTWQSYPGEYGDECRDFWLDARGCDGASSRTDLGYGAADECVAYTGCSAEVRYCLYGPQTAHQVPGYYAEATMDFFRGF